MDMTREMRDIKAKIQDRERRISDLQSEIVDLSDGLDELRFRAGYARECSRLDYSNLAAFWPDKEERDRFYLLHRDLARKLNIPVTGSDMESGEISAEDILEALWDCDYDCLMDYFGRRIKAPKEKMHV